MILYHAYIATFSELKGIGHDGLIVCKAVFLWLGCLDLPFGHAMR